MAYTSKTRIVAKGTGDIYIADPLTGGKKLGQMTDEDWSKIMTSLRGTFVISQEEGETSESFIDQSDLPIASTTTAGKMTISWDLPNTARQMWELLYNTVTDISTHYGTAAAGTEVIGVQTSTKKISKMLKVDLKGDGQTYIFPNLEWSRLFTKDNDDDPARFTITTTVLAAVDSSNADFWVINAMDGTAD